MGTEFWICTEGLRVFPFLLPQEVFLRLQTKSVQCRHRKNPNSLHLMVYAGQNGEFELYEDDNVSCAYEERICCTTKMVYCEDEKPIFTIYPSAGNRDLILRNGVIQLK